MIKPKKVAIWIKTVLYLLILATICFEFNAVWTQVFDFYCFLQETPATVKYPLRMQIAIAEKEFILFTAKDWKTIETTILKWGYNPNRFIVFNIASKETVISLRKVKALVK